MAESDMVIETRKDMLIQVAKNRKVKASGDHINPLQRMYRSMLVVVLLPFGNRLTKD